VRLASHRHQILLPKTTQRRDAAGGDHPFQKFTTVHVRSRGCNGWAMLAGATDGPEPADPINVTVTLRDGPWRNQ
jgi:hypothetical protein